MQRINTHARDSFRDAQLPTRLARLLRIDRSPDKSRALLVVIGQRDIHRHLAQRSARWHDEYLYLESIMQYKRLVIREQELTDTIGLASSTVADMQNPKSPRFDPDFPPKVRLGARAVGWFMEDVLVWLSNRKEVSQKGGKA